MWILIVTLIIVAAVLIWFWVIKTKSAPESEIPVYVCPEGGDHHGSCYLEEK
ncbi:MAG: hypothetical protein JRG75_00855 [Deltaproteobacteria bacterium]|nr:hypothetical protein [Deltaproteobacteria bacterium]